MGKYDAKTNQGGNKWVGIVLALMFLNPALFVPLGMMAGIAWIIVKSAGGNRKGTSGKSRTNTRYTTRQASFDECPQSFFCFHKDKAEHHVRRGKEIDPWDRPDIDISKYQRNR